MLGLSPKELRYAKLIALGWQDKQIAHELNITHGTTNTYRTRIFKKLNANNRTEVARILTNHAIWSLLREILPEAEIPGDVWLAVEAARAELKKR